VQFLIDVAIGHHRSTIKDRGETGELDEQEDQCKVVFAKIWKWIRGLVCVYEVGGGVAGSPLSTLPSYFSDYSIQ
jgi:hypothetical protein